MPHRETDKERERLEGKKKKTMELSICPCEQCVLKSLDRTELESENTVKEGEERRNEFWEIISDGKWRWRNLQSMKLTDLGHAEVYKRGEVHSD